MHERTDQRNTADVDALTDDLTGDPTTASGSCRAEGGQRSGLGWLRLSGADGPLLGTMVTVDAPEVSEALAGSGLDWLLIDMEHAPTLNAGRVQRVLQAVNRRCRTVVRVQANDPSLIGAALDAGCDGVLIPHVVGPDDAARAVQAAKYPLAGRRSVGIARAHSYGAMLDDYLRHANDSTAVILQVEDESAVDGIDAILAVPGVAGVFVGPYDLSGSMGWPGTPDHSAVLAAIDHVRDRCRAAGVPMGIFASDPTAAAEQTERGADLLAVGTDLTLLIGTVHAALAYLRGHPGRDAFRDQSAANPGDG